MKKLLLVIIMLLSIVTFGQTTKKTVCNIIEKGMKQTYPSLKASYTGSSLVLIISINDIATYDLPAEELRALLPNPKMMQAFSNGFAEGIQKSPEVLKLLNDIGFYYVCVIVRDDRLHYYHEYRSNFIKL